MSEPKKRGRPRKEKSAEQVQTIEEQAKDIVSTKRKRNRPDLANFGQEYVQPGDNTKYITFAMESRNLPKINFDNNEEVKERIDWYFTRCAENDMKPGIVGMANALGVDRNTMYMWKIGERRAEQPGFQDMIKQAYSLVEEMWEFYMQNGKISPPNGIFLGKNHFGYKDVQEVVVEPHNPYENGKPDNVRDKYIEGMQNDISAEGNVE